jgi:hypothetical protein
MLEDYKHDIVKGFFTGIFGGIGLFILKLIGDWYLERRDMKRILKYFANNKEFTFYNTYKIASSTNLTESRVIFICSNSKELKRNEKEAETWSLR